MNILPGRENQSASFDSRSEDIMLDTLEQPAISGAAKSSSSSLFR
jgi:hypothetical protein